MKRRISVLIALVFLSASTAHGQQSYQTKDAFGNIVDSKKCFQTKDTFGNFVQSAGCNKD